VADSLSVSRPRLASYPAIAMQIFEEERSDLSNCTLVVGYTWKADPSIHISGEVLQRLGMNIYWTGVFIQVDVQV
jgi:hypothetical protein